MIDSVLPITEQANDRTSEIGSASTIEVVRMMNAEDKLVAGAVEKVLPEVSGVVDAVAERLRNSGRLFYVGTGTSGRLGVLDASECPPTFGVSPELVQGIIAGGYEALYRAVEASEDDAEAGACDLEQRGVTGRDAVIGLAASGRTPYTIGAVQYARSLGALTASITCVPDSAITLAAELNIVAVVGPEAITGSTRLKAGTAQKLILNMISTATLIRLGYVSGNRMSNVQTRNIKLRERALRILMAETGLAEQEARALLEQTDNNLSASIVMSRAGSGFAETLQALKNSNGVIEQAVRALTSD